MRSVELIVPCFNEEESLNSFYESTQKVFGSLPGYCFSYIFVDDGSSDRTLATLIKLASKDDTVKYIAFSRNFGKEAAMYAGMKKSSADLVCIIDADLQHPPELIKDMLSKIEDGHDCCAARRVSRKGEPLLKSAFSRLFYKIINRMSEIDIVEGAVDYRIMTRQMVDAILELSEVQRFSKGIFTWIGFDTYWIEFENIERTKGSSKWSFWKLMKYAADGITSFSTVPLRIASVFGLIVSITAFLYLAGVVIKTLIVGVDVPGYASLITMILFIGGVIILSCGILGEYIARIYTEVRKRPIFIEKKSNILNDKNKKGTNQNGHDDQNK